MNKGHDTKLVVIHGMSPVGFQEFWLKFQVKTFYSEEFLLAGCLLFMIIYPVRALFMQILWRSFYLG